MSEEASDFNELSHKSTEELKHQLLQLTREKDTDPLNQKVNFYKNELAPFFEELSRRNPFPVAEDQAAIVLGVWSPIWSTIPFQDTIPGRLHDQSYQIFHDDGYYANMARYAPGNKLSFLQKLSLILLAYDFMVVQKFEVKDGQWYIQNISIEQAFRVRAIPLSIDKAEAWFSAIASSKLTASQSISSAPNFENLDKTTAKKFEKVFLATPRLEHLYIDPDFRLVKTQREAKQRPSYTIAVRR